MHDVLELRQYTLYPGQRDVLIDLFDREFIETQEAEGITVLGQFRDLDRPDRFVWLRGWPDMQSRGRGLAGFYGGPAWKAHSSAANATMIDSSDVLLLRPASPGSGFPAQGQRPPIGSTASPRSRVLATICYRDRPFDVEFSRDFDERTRPELAAAGAAPLAWFMTEYAENNFPALPVRTGEHAFVWFARFSDEDALGAYLKDADQTPERLRLTPTARSLLC